MARSRITDTGRKDLITDAGSVLFSFVKGEQLEFPVTLNFLEDATAGYTYEAVVVEAQNLFGQTGKPTTVLAGGVQTVIPVRVPTNRGTWDAVQAYNTAEVVSHSGIVYQLVAGAAVVNAVTPDLDPNWTVTTLNKIHLQFPTTLADTYAISASVNSPIYGFFELRVTEPNTSVYRRTWKPIRGMIEILFSPTDIVP